MGRRGFLQSLAAASVVSPIASYAAEAMGLAASPPGSNPAWSLGFRSIDQDELNAGLLSIEGKLPQALRGALYRNGPARYERGRLRYHHWFDGDGMAQAYRFTDQGISHHAKYIHTEKYRAEEKAGKFTRAAFGTIFPGIPSPPSADSVNVANISMLVHADELLALWEGGSAYRLNLDTLQALGKKTWREDLAGAPFSAHPKVDPDGTLWNFGAIGQNDLLVLYRISPRGVLQKAEAISCLGCR
jgi:carotenoid cleavage dioxygenase